MNRALAKRLLLLWEHRAVVRDGKVKRAKRGTLLWRVRVERLTTARVKVMQYKRWLEAHPVSVKPPVHRTQRDLVLDWCGWALKHEPDIHYLQRRPMRLADGVNRTLPLYCDCSESTTMAYKYAGAPDPSGLGYNSTGNTALMRNHLQRIDKTALKPGDLIIYGTNDLATQHVVIVLEPGPDPLVFSHGQEAGPFRIRHSIELAAHHSIATYHRGELR